MTGTKQSMDRRVPASAGFSGLFFGLAGCGRPGGFQLKKPIALFVSIDCTNMLRRTTVRPIPSPPTQKGSKQMSLINTQVKPFKATAYHNGKFVEVSDATLKGKWSVIVFYPADFTIVCA